MGLGSFLAQIGEGLIVGIQHGKFRELLAIDRDTACRNLAALVEQATPADLEEFEKTFLQHSIAVVGTSQRLRAMELYAHFKICETAHYGQFCGFLGGGGRLSN